MRLAKEELIEFEGSVLELLPDARFRVKLDNGHETLAYSSGKMKKTASVFLPAIASRSK